MNMPRWVFAVVAACQLGTIVACAITITTQLNH